MWFNLWNYETTYQGLFLAPHVAIEAVKGAIFCSRIMELAGFDVLPKFTEQRSDIIQAIKFNDKEKLINFCKGIPGRIANRFICSM